MEQLIKTVMSNMEQLTKTVTSINEFLWGAPLIIILAGIGFVSTLYLGFPQVRYFVRGWKQLFSGIFSKEETQEGSMSSFQSLATAVAAQVGTGNVAGVGTAIMSGGPGAIFWMWFLAFLGMATIQVEALLAQKYRERTPDGELVGGPAYYIKHGFERKGLGVLGKVLAGFFAIMIVIALGIVGNMVQSNSIAEALNSAFGLPSHLVGIVLAIVAAFIFIGGMSRIAKFAELVVPIMAVVYIIGSIVVVVTFRENIGPVFSQIFQGAFSGIAIAGGTIGFTVRQAIRYGAARGLFSNEAGMGSTPNSHAVADVKHPTEQALVASISVFIDTGLVCTATALVILATGVNEDQSLEGVQIAMEGFRTAFGDMGAGFLAIALTAFAFTTLVSWYYFGEGNIKHLTKSSKLAVRLYQIIVFLAVILGAVLNVELVWQLADLTNALMVIPNVIALFVLLPESKELYQDYLRQYDSGQQLTYTYVYENL